jgi:hypothetical protein
VKADQVREEIEILFNPEPREGGVVRHGLGQPRLTRTHGLDLSYLETMDWEGSSGHKHTRLGDGESLDALTRSSDMPDRLMYSALQLLGDSIVAYADADKRDGEFRYYPAVVLTFWSGFESFVRYSSELLLLTVPGIPAPVALYLKELENVVDAHGKVSTRTRYQSVLDRYSVFLFHAYGLKIDRGSAFWQGLAKAKALRDSYTHVDVNTPRAITTSEVLEFIERTLLGLIWPSSLAARTLMLHEYLLYEIWEGLGKLAEDFRERPFFLDWHLKEPSLFHCNFDGVDEERYPSVRSERYHDIFSARVKAHREGKTGEG